MDEVVLKKLTRQLKLLNIWISVFGTLTLVAAIVVIFMLYQLITFVQDTSDRLTAIQESTSNSLDLRKQICEQEGIAGLLGGRSQICE